MATVSDLMARAPDDDRGWFVVPATGRKLGDCWLTSADIVLLSAMLATFEVPQHRQRRASKQALALHEAQDRIRRKLGLTVAAAQRRLLETT